jgi:fatty-acyl-CoA synthase
MKELLDITVGGLLEQMARRFPERLAVKYTDRPYEEAGAPSTRKSTGSPEA